MGPARSAARGGRRRFHTRAGRNAWRGGRIGLREIDSGPRADWPRPRRGTGRMDRRNRSSGAEPATDDGLSQRHPDDLSGSAGQPEPAHDSRADHLRTADHPSPRLAARRGQGPRAPDDDAGRPAAQPDQPLSARIQRWPVPAHRHRPRADRRTEAHHLRRAGVGAGRVDPGAGHQPADPVAARPGAGVGVHRPRPVGGKTYQRPGDGAVSGQGDGNRDLGCPLCAAAASLYAGPAVGGAGARSRD